MVSTLQSSGLVSPSQKDENCRVFQDEGPAALGIGQEVGDRGEKRGKDSARN